MSLNLTKMAFGDIRLVSFLWNKWLLPGDSLTGTPILISVEPITSVSLVGVVGSTITCLVTAGNFDGTGQVSCEVKTLGGEQATRTVYIPVKALVTNAIQ